MLNLRDFRRGFGRLSSACIAVVAVAALVGLTTSEAIQEGRKSVYTYMCIEQANVTGNRVCENGDPVRSIAKNLISLSSVFSFSYSRPLKNQLRNFGRRTTILTTEPSMYPYPYGPTDLRTHPSHTNQTITLPLLEMHN